MNRILPLPQLTPIPLPLNIHASHGIQHQTVLQTQQNVKHRIFVLQHVPSLGGEGRSDSHDGFRCPDEVGGAGNVSLTVVVDATGVEGAGVSVDGGGES